MTNLC